MKGTSHPGSPLTGGFRNTANGGQYDLKIVNIGGICQVIYMCQTSCCQLVALCL